MSELPDCGYCGQIYVEARCPEHGSLLEPPAPCEPRVSRRFRRGMFRWLAQCAPCGWEQDGYSQPGAQSLAEAHAEGRMR